MILILILDAVIDVTIFINILHTFLYAKSKYITIVTELLLTSILLTANYKNQFVYYLLFFLISIIYMKVNSRGTINKNVVVVTIAYSSYLILYFSCFMLEDILSDPLILSQNRDRFPFVLILFLSTILYYILYRIFKNKLGCLKLDNTDLYLLSVGNIVLTLLMSLILILTLYTAISFYYTFLLSVLVVLIFFLYILLIILYLKTKEVAIKDRLNVSLERMQQKYTTELKEIFEKNRKLQHDLQNHMFVIDTFIKEKRMGQLKNYVSSLKDSSYEFQGSYYERIALSALIYTKKKLMEQQDIHFVLNLESEWEKVDDFSLTVILGNLLDNAIEAQQWVSGYREIRLHLGDDGGYSFLKLSNTYEKNKIKKEHGSYITTKEDQNHHGLGIQNVKQCVEKKSRKVINL